MSFKLSKALRHSDNVHLNLLDKTIVKNYGESTYKISSVKEVFVVNKLSSTKIYLIIKPENLDTNMIDRLVPFSFYSKYLFESAFTELNKVFPIRFGRGVKETRPATSNWLKENYDQV